MDGRAEQGWGGGDGGGPSAAIGCGGEGRMGWERCSVCSINQKVPGAALVHWIQGHKGGRNT